MSRTPADYQRLAAFVVVAEQTSFTKAARMLGVGKGTVSRAVAQLERQMGVELIHRTTHTVGLSSAGRALYEQTAPHVFALDQAAIGVPERAPEPSGELRIASIHEFGLSLLPEALIQFARRFPKIRIEVQLTSAHLDLVATGFDLAICATSAKLRDSTLRSRRLAEVLGGFYAAPSYLTRHGYPKRLGDAKHSWILHSAAAKSWKLPREMLVRFQCDDTLLIRNLAQEGAGIGMLPHFVAAPHVREGLLHEVLLTDRPDWRGALFLVYPSSGQVPRKVTAFRDFLFEWLRNTPLR
jgi:DNA-binding transcriptional LysR family regulator